MINLKLDKNGGINKGDIVVSEHDNKSEEYIIQLIKNNNILDISNKSVIMTIINKETKEGDIFNLSIYNAREGQVKLEVTSNLTKCNGEYIAKIKLKDSTGYEESFPIFDITINIDLVEELSGEIIQNPSFTILNTSLAKVQEWDNYFKEVAPLLENKYTTRLTKIEKEILSTNINIKYPPNNINPCIMDGISDDSTNFQKIHDYACQNYNHVTLLIPNGNMLIKNTLNIDVEKVSIKSNGIIISDVGENNYAFKFGYTGTTSNNYKKGRTVYEGLFVKNINNELTGRSNGALFGGTTESVGSSNITLRNCMFHDFDKGLTFSDRSYLIRFDHCDLYSNLIAINIIGGADTGENIMFNSCVIANGETALYCNNEFATVFFSNCSIDYNWKQIFNIIKGDIYVSDCHIEHSLKQFFQCSPFILGNYDGNHLNITNSRIIFARDYKNDLEITPNYIFENLFIDSPTSCININNCFLQGLKTKTGYIGFGYINSYNNQVFKWDNQNQKLSEFENLVHDWKFWDADLNNHPDYMILNGDTSKIQLFSKFALTSEGDNWFGMKKLVAKGEAAGAGFLIPLNKMCSNFGAEFDICCNVENSNIDIGFGKCRFINGQLKLIDNMYYEGLIGVNKTIERKKLKDRILTNFDNKQDFLYLMIQTFNCEINTEIYLKNVEIYQF